MKKSLFNKVYEVLEIAKRSPVNSKSELVSTVEAEGLEIFQSWRYNEDIDEMEERQSVASIRNTINLASDLGFLKADNMDFSPEKALRYFSKEDFSRAIRSATVTRLYQFGITLDELNSIVSRALGNKLKDYPTASFIYGKLRFEISKARFGRYLSLLQSSSAAEVCSKKLFLGFRS